MAALALAVVRLIHSFASAIGEIFVFSDDFKTGFLQRSYRPDVVRCYPGENRPIYNKLEHPIASFQIPASRLVR